MEHQLAIIRSVHVLYCATRTIWRDLVVCKDQSECIIAADMFSPDHHVTQGHSRNGF